MEQLMTSRLKLILGQAGKLRSATTPKLASWNVHEQSFSSDEFWRSISKKQHLFEGPRRIPPAKPARTSQGVRRTPFEKPCSDAIASHFDAPQAHVLIRRLSVKTKGKCGQFCEKSAVRVLPLQRREK